MQRDRQWQLWLLLLVLLLPWLSGCSLPQVRAEDRLFLPVSIDFLDEYQIPKQDYQSTKVGGLSGMTYDRQRDQYYVVSDDRSDFAPARFYTMAIPLDVSNPAKPQIKTVDITGVTSLKDATGQPYAKGSVDLEGIALSPLDTLFITSEGVATKGIDPFICEVDRQTGAQRRCLPVPDRYLPRTQDGITQGVADNLGFESLTISPGSASEPFRLFTATELALVQDTDLEIDRTQGSRSRMLHYMVEADRSLYISEHLYPLEPAPSGAPFHGLTEILAIDQGGHFLSLERSFGKQGNIVRLFQLATGGASDTSTIESFKGNTTGIQPVRKRLLLDLTALGIRLDNLEALTLGPRLPDGSTSLLLMSDDNFNPNQVNQVLLFRLKGVK